MNSDWSWWQAKLAGQPMQANPDLPHAGFYRQSHKAFYGARKTYTPVAYYPDPETGRLRCRIGDAEVDDVLAMQTWDHVNEHPVTEEAYRLVAEQGGMWPDEHPLVPMRKEVQAPIDSKPVALGHNKPPAEDSFESLQADIEDLAADANRRIDGPPIKTQDDADQIANLADRLSELWKKADELRKAEKRPHDEAAMLVQRKWAPLLLAAEAYKNLKYKLLTPWLHKLTLQAKQEAEEAAAAGAPIPVEKPRPRVGTRGRAMSLKSSKRAEITDYQACLAFFAESPDIKTTVQDLANRAVRGGITVPGTKVVEEEKTV
jgi:hypothetical protein